MIQLKKTERSDFTMGKNNKTQDSLSASHTSTKQTITYHLLKEALIHHDFKPGSTLTERKLCSYFAVSRPPVHNAVLQLVSEGLLSLDVKKGITVPEINITELREIFEMLETLQVTAFSSQRRNFSREDHIDFKNILERMQSILNDISSDHYQCFLQDQDFHTKIVSASSNQRLKSSFETYSNQYAAYSAILFSAKNRGYHIIDLHTPIYNAIRNQSVQDFKKHLHYHYVNILENFSELT